jgi:hypothetical protein
MNIIKEYKKLKIYKYTTKKIDLKRCLSKKHLRQPMRNQKTFCDNLFKSLEKLTNIGINNDATDSEKELKDAELKQIIVDSGVNKLFKNNESRKKRKLKVHFSFKFDQFKK